MSVFPRLAVVCAAITVGLVFLFFVVPGGPCGVNLDFLALAIPAFIATCVFTLIPALSSRGAGVKLDSFLGWFDGTGEARADQRRLLQQRLNRSPHGR